MKEALYWKPLKNKVVNCRLCPRLCVIQPNSRGNCCVRENVDGKLYSLVYAKPSSIGLDPIEKKPLYHFMPGEQTLSIATAGCNLHCMFCQNWQISQVKPEEIQHLDMPPKMIVDKATSSNVRIISYTYTEPTIFYEYMYDIAKLASKKKIRNTTVTNGFINQEPLKALCKYLDASNIDFKGSDKYYRKLTGAWRKPIEQAIKLMQEKKVWIELTTLIVPGHNDKTKDIKEIALWIKSNLGLDVPWHLSAFYPTYKMKNIMPTKTEITIKAREIALKQGLHYVYTGNVLDRQGSTTFCPQCRKPLILREGFYVRENRLTKGKCPYCNEKIPGVWK